LILILLFLATSDCFAATQLKKTVKPSGGDYTSLEACVNANEQNLVTADIAARLEVEKDYTVDEKMHATFITDEGISKAEKLLGIDNIYAAGGVKLVHHLETAIKAKALYIKDKEYVVRDNEVVIVDPYTGRLQPGRRWSEGLHQAIEAKEGVSVQKESKTFASITYQNYFRMYKKLAKDGEGAAIQIIFNPVGNYYNKLYKEALDEIQKGESMTAVSANLQWGQCMWGL
jgi:hypothetical protein